MRRRANRRPIKARIRIIRYNEWMRRSKKEEREGEVNWDEAKPELPNIRPLEKEADYEFVKREHVNGQDVLWPYDVYRFEERWTDFYTQQRRKREHEVYCKEFDGAHDIVTFLEKVADTSPMMASTVYGQGFYREANSYEAHKFIEALEGKREFPELQVIKEIVEKIEATGVFAGSRKRSKLTRRDQGDELDIHSMRNGNLSRCWTAKKRIRTKGKGNKEFIHLAIDITTYKGSRAHWFAACAFLFARAAERSGKKVKISCLSLWRGDGTHSHRGLPVDNLTIDTVKQYGERTNLNTLAALSSKQFDVTIDAIIDANGKYRSQDGWHANSSGEFLNVTKQVVSRKSRNEDLIWCEIGANMADALAWLQKHCKRLRITEG